MEVCQYHLTGVGNDGGDSFQYAIEVGDNAKDNDVLIIFCKNPDSIEYKRLISAVIGDIITVYSQKIGELKNSIVRC